MSGYEEEHSIPRTTTTSTSSQPRRPDLSSFFTALDLTNTSSTTNPHAEPTPSTVSAAFRMLANALQVMGGETEGVAIDHGFPARNGDGAGEHLAHTQLLEGMIETLMMGAERPPGKVEGMSDAWFDGTFAHFRNPAPLLLYHLMQWYTDTHLRTRPYTQDLPET